MPRSLPVCRCLFTLIAAMLTFAHQTTAQQLVRFDSYLGKFDIELFANTPQTNANFLTYVNAGDFTNTFLHRHATDFVLQGGGFKFENDQFSLVNQNDPVINEPFNSHFRGTVAMAKLGTDPNSATNQWFFNLADNRSILDAGIPNEQNGGFTAFAQVAGDGMELIDAMRSVPFFNASSITSAFDTLPLRDFLNDGNPITGDNLLIFSQIASVSNALGDLNESGDFDAEDIDLLYAQYGTALANDLNFDLDSSGVVDNADRDRLIERIADTRLGDVNFDGAVDILTDGAALVNSLGTLTGATYAEGDLNGDGAVDVLGDGTALIENLGFNRNNIAASVSTAAVPEPTSALFLVAASIAASLRRRR